MKGKNLILGIASFLLTVLALSLTVSAAASLSGASNILTNNSRTATLTLNPEDLVTNNATISLSDIVSGSNTIDLSVNPTSITNFNTSKTITVSASSGGSQLPFGEYSSNLLVYLTNSSGDVKNLSQTITFRQGFCKSGPNSSPNASLVIQEVSISNDGEGDDSEWKILDKITVTVDVENIGTEDVREVYLEIGFLDDSGANKISKFKSLDDKLLSLGRINEGDTQTEEFVFDVPATFDDGNYKLILKAYSKNAGEENVCADTSSDLSRSYYEPISIVREDDEGKYIKFNNIRTSPTEVTCGDTLTVDFDVLNVGDVDQDRIKVRMFSSALKVDVTDEIKRTFNPGDSAGASLSIVIPQNLQAKTYLLELSAEYDYDDNKYREVSDETTKFPIAVFGCSVAQNQSGSANTNLVSISADLASKAVAGEELVIKAKITNLQNKEMSYVINVGNYDDWASLSSISDRVLILKVGETKEITIKFDVDSDASGENGFYLEARDGDKATSKQISVDITKRFSLSSLFEGNGLIWIIAIVNVILIVIIILVAVRIARR